MTFSTATLSKSSDTANQTAERPLVHPVSAALLVAVDSLWGIADWNALSWIVSIPLSFLSVFISTLLVQRFLKRDSRVRAATLATALGTIAAVPTPVTGTAVGAFVLALAGFRSLRRHQA